MQSDRSIMNPERGCILGYDRYASKYVLHMPRTVATANKTVNDLNCGIDPGIRTFLTVYSKNDVLEIGKNVNYDKYFKKIDKLNTFFDINDENKDKQCCSFLFFFRKKQNENNSRIFDSRYEI
ncbi:MAG: hypothetical protein EOP34_07465 [Rickettsiales bacterium]|nr:MAG: hypothetical protein EOP34_07465 [Rickettsiales bacterium]